MTASAPRRSRLSLSIGLALALVTGTALASDYAKVATHTTTKSADHVLGVLTAYSQTCKEGCKYKSPDIAKLVQLSHKKTATSWYTWTWISHSVRDVKYFSRVSLNKKPNGTFVLTTRMIGEKEEALIAELEKASGQENKPALDSSRAIYTIEPLEGGKTKLTQDIVVSASGMIDMFGGAIKDGIAAATVANVQNIEK